MKKLALATTIALSVALPLPSSAGTLLSGFATHHFQGQGWRNNNTGIGYRFDNGMAVGYFRNSEDRDSFYVAKEWRYKYVGVLAGAVTGYSGGKVIPLVMPELVLDVGKVEIAALINPIKIRETPQFVAFQIRYSF